MTDKDNEAIWIYQHLGIELKINVSKRSISALKRFIEVLEYNPDDNLSLEDYVILEDLPQDERQPTEAGDSFLAQVYSVPNMSTGTPPHTGGRTRTSPYCQCDMCVSYRKQAEIMKRMDKTQLGQYGTDLMKVCFKNEGTYDQFINYMGFISNPGHPPAKSGIGSIPIQIKELQIEAKPISAGEREDLDVKIGTSPQKAPERNLSVPKKAGFFIPRFTWDKTKEKSYRTIFFFEHEDGRVMISYMQSKLFTTKELVLTLPYPVPHHYTPLRNIDNNKRTAFRFYREYLAKEAASHELVRWKDKNNEAILLYEAENKDEDEIMSEAAKEAEEKRMEKLRKAVEVNAGRWKESDMSPRTKELRKNIVLKATMGVGAD